MRPSFFLVLLAVALASGAAADPRPDRVDDWLYVLQLTEETTLERLADAGFDLAVIDYSRDGTEGGELLPSEVAALRASGKVVIAYLSIGEAEDVRFYWRRQWEDQPPPWLGPSNPDFPDNYKVRYWDPAWQAIVFAYLDRIVDQGFDGVYLDIIDAFTFWSEEEGERGRDRARRDMIAFVEAIAAHAREARGVTDFLVFPQNGVDVVLDDDDVLDAAGRRFLAAIDGVGVEDVFYDELTPAPAADTSYRVGILEDFQVAGKVVLSVDYVWDPRAPLGQANVRRYNDYQARSLAQGFVPYAAIRDRDLDEVVEVAGEGGFDVPQPKPSTGCTGEPVLCLLDDRFEVRVSWRDFDGNRGVGRPVEGVSSPDSGIFFFFAPENWEMLVKVLDGCDLNDHFWVFAAATTNVEYVLTVIDRVTGARREYVNPLGRSSAAITDTSAFATCASSP